MVKTSFFPPPFFWIYFSVNNRYFSKSQPRGPQPRGRIPVDMATEGGSGWDLRRLVMEGHVDRRFELFRTNKEEGRAHNLHVAATSSSTSSEQTASLQPNVSLPTAPHMPLHLLRPVHPLHWAAKQGLANTRQGVFEERPPAPSAPSTPRTVNWGGNTQHVVSSAIPDTQRSTSVTRMFGNGAKPRDFFKTLAASIKAEHERVKKNTEK